MNIILIKFNQPEFEEKCIESINKYTKIGKHTLTVYDNYQKKENLAVVWNRLIEESKEENICLLNTDTIVEEGWERMAQVLKRKDCGAVGPVTDNCGTRQKGMTRGGIEEINDLSGFCYLFRKSVWKEVGKFPEDMPFYGQESIFNRKLQDHGYKLLVDRRTFVHHAKSKSYNKAIETGDIKEDERFYGAFHYWNYCARLKRLREKVKQGTKIMIYGAGNGFPLARGATQFLNDFCGNNGIGVGDVQTARDKIEHRHPDIYITTQTKIDESWKIAKELKNKGVKTALYFCDLRSPKAKWPYQIELPEDFDKYFDKVFLCAKGKLTEWKDCGVPVYHLPQATLQHPTPPRGFKYRLVHIGDLQTEYHTERKELLEGLGFVNLNETNREKRLKLSKESFGIYGESDLSLSVSHDVEGYTSDRLYHILGAGGCALAFNPGGIPFEHGKHLLWFKTRQELEELKRTPDEEIAKIKKEAFKEVQTKHLYKDRFIELLCNL